MQYDLTIKNWRDSTMVAKRESQNRTKHRETEWAKSDEFEQFLSDLD